MPYSIRHSVFVSSTFTDLKEERAEVIQAIWEMDCIPTGMEAFVASNDSQWEVIRRVIDECDYYVLILGGRYGSVAADGISYTEKEYHYAKKAGLPVLAFVHGAPEEIPLGKSEKDDQLRAKLATFREEVMRAHPVRKWTTSEGLGAVVSRSLTRERQVTPRPGWIRNDGSSPLALLEQVNRLTEENRSLRESASELATGDADDALQSGSDETELFGQRSWYEELNRYRQDWHVLVSWDDIWSQIGAILINEASELDLERALAQMHRWEDGIEEAQIGASSTIDTASWHEVLIQFRALGYIVPGTKKRGVSDRGRYWKITPRGDYHLMRLRAKKRMS